MGRRYVRDNRGRFASTGATARGGRLRTEAGNKRATQTMQATGGRAGVISKPRALKADVNAKVKAETNQRLRARAAARSSVTPSTKRVLVKANARPENLFTRATNKQAAAGYGTDQKANVANARRQIEAAGVQSALKSNKRSSSVASVSENKSNVVSVNASHTAWRNPRADMIKSRRKNEFSTASPGHYVAHELGHIKNPSGRMARSWEAQLRGKGQIYADSDKVINARRTARRVSRYAMTQPAEFAAETRAGLSLGKRYDSKVMSLYRGVTGRQLPSVRSQQRAQGVTGAYVSPRASRRRRR